jgi:hypothetical protein
MAKFIAPPLYARIRQVPGDDRLHITDMGTTSGLPRGLGLELASGEYPWLAFELNTADGYDPEAKLASTMVEVSSRRIFAADLDALTFPAHDLFGQQLRRAADDLRDCLLPGDPPPCAHEDVIDVSWLGRGQAEGMCAWCGTTMVADLVPAYTRGAWRTA